MSCVVGVATSKIGVGALTVATQETENGIVSLPVNKRTLATKNIMNDTAN